MFSAEGYQALRQGAGLVRRGDRGILAVGGPDRLTWLQGLLTNDVVALPLGGVCEAAYLTPQGRMITDMRVINLAEQTLLDVPGSLAEALRSKLDGLLFSEDARIADLTRSLLVLDGHGPQAPLLLDKLPEQLNARVIVIADSPYGVQGFSVFVPADDFDAVQSALAAGGGVVTTLETLDVIRVEAGRPAFLIDMDEHTIPLEAGIENRVISFTKGCYVGQEIIVRVMQRGHGRVAKKLAGLRLEKAELPKPGDLIFAGDREIGRVTSAVWSPTLERGIALGYLHRDYLEVDTPVLVMTPSGPVDAQVSSLPFIANRTEAEVGHEHRTL
jgi:tRNA-modifying protein YgfZ